MAESARLPSYPAPQSSLDNAMRAFIRTGGDRCAMLIPLWAVTYHVEPDAVRASWERLMSEHSQKPTNQYEEFGGK